MKIERCEQLATEGVTRKMINSGQGMKTDDTFHGYRYTLLRVVGELKPCTTAFWNDSALHSIG